MENNHYLIVYDIRDTKRLVKVARCIESYAYRMQKSVFEMYAPESTIRYMRRDLERLIDKDVDFVLVFNICEKDYQKRQTYGINKLDTNNFDDAYIIL